MARKVMKFLVPNTMNDLLLDGFDRGDRESIQMYLNPQSVKIVEKKLIQHKLTKGGFMVQYWGEDLPVIQAKGTTGSGGIEAINILRDVYRHEQLAFKRLLIARAKSFETTAFEAIEEVPSESAQIGTTEVLDSFTGGGFSRFVDGAKSTIQSVTDAFNGATGASELLGPHTPVTLVPSLGAFAVSIDLYFQKEKFRGFFKDFSVDESADKPGLFNYSFSFVVTKRAGRRKNFMPWHRSPNRGRGENKGKGSARPASIPIEGPSLDELTFESNIRTKTQRDIAGRAKSKIKRTGDQNSNEVDRNNVGVNWKKKSSGS